MDPLDESDAVLDVTVTAAPPADPSSCFAVQVVPEPAAANTPALAVSTSSFVSTSAPLALGVMAKMSSVAVYFVCEICAVGSILAAAEVVWDFHVNVLACAAVHVVDAAAAKIEFAATIVMTSFARRAVFGVNEKSMFDVLPLLAETAVEPAIAVASFEVVAVNALWVAQIGMDDVIVTVSLETWFVVGVAINVTVLGISPKLTLSGMPEVQPHDVPSVVS